MTNPISAISVVNQPIKQLKLFDNMNISSLSVPNINKAGFRMQQGSKLIGLSGSRALCRTIAGITAKTLRSLSWEHDMRIKPPPTASFSGAVAPAMTMAYLANVARRNRMSNPYRAVEAGRAAENARRGLPNQTPRTSRSRHSPSLQHLIAAAA